MRFTLAEMDHQNGVPFKIEKSGLEAVRTYLPVRYVRTYLRPSYVSNLDRLYKVTHFNSV